MNDPTEEPTHVVAPEDEQNERLGLAECVRHPGAVVLFRKLDHVECPLCKMIRRVEELVEEAEAADSGIPEPFEPAIDWERVYAALNDARYLKR